jgi:hypothetical protein
MKRKRRARDIARVRVPDEQSPFMFLPGKSGGWFVILLWNYGGGLDVPWQQLRRLLAGSTGEVLIARRLEGKDLALFNSYGDIAHEIHARLIFTDHMRWGRAPRRKQRT